VAALTVNVTALLVTLPVEFDTTTANVVPLSAVVVGGDV
jgi:Zn-dependent membrane protease YugP